MSSDTAISQEPLSARRPPRGRVLLVDDDELLLAANARVLRRESFDVVTAESGDIAIEKLRQTEVDVVVTDISMPRYDGIQLLRAVRQEDRDLPVVLVTGVPAVSSAAKAVELGAFRYLLKPFEPAELVSTVVRATQLRRLGRAKRLALSVLGQTSGEASGIAGLESSFRQALSTLWMAFQPIVYTSDQTLLGYEALLRCSEPSLPHPGAVLDAAERLGELTTLGRTTRHRAASMMREAHPEALLFINLHPEDLADPHLLDESVALSEIADRVVLEITERASLDRVPGLDEHLVALRALGFRIAIDDLGEGYAGLSSFVRLDPDFVKLDMSLVRHIDASSIKRRLVASMVAVCRDMGLQVIAEGVETDAELGTLIELGCDLMQGYRFGHPARPFPEPTW